MIVVGFALLVIEQQTDYALLIGWSRRGGCFTLEADELLIEAELLTLTTTKRWSRFTLPTNAQCQYQVTRSLLNSRPLGSLLDTWEQLC